MEITRIKEKKSLHTFKDSTALLLSGSISQTCKKILQLYCFNFLYVHITMNLNGLKN